MSYEGYPVQVAIMIKKIISRQLAKPNGLVGRFLLAPLWNRRNALLNDRTLASLHLQEDDRVLDIGFGGGYLLAQMCKSLVSGHLVGVDASAAMVRRAGKKFRRAMRCRVIDLLPADAETLPFADAAFDKISSVNSIFYWRDLGRGIQEIHRVLRPAGRLVVTFTDQQDLEKQGFSPFGVHSYSADNVATALREAGFIQIESYRDRDSHRGYMVLISHK